MRLTAKEISQRLALQVENVCRYLLPHGKKINAEWRCGDAFGAEGDSMGVRLIGEKSGIWSDFASGTDKGDLLDLWALVKGQTLGSALAQAKEWLGLKIAAPVNPTKTYVRPKPKGIAKSSTPEASPMIQYLTQERKLIVDTVNAFKIGQRGNDIAYPSFSPTGTLLNVKYIGLTRTPEGKKTISQETGCAPSLFGWQSFDPASRNCVITEGQIDAMTWHQWGMQALSVPNGVGDLNNWIDYEWDNLAVFDRIYLSFDNDEAGKKAVVQVAKRLGIYRCMIVSLPCKDANDCLKQGFTGEHAARALMDSKVLSPDEIKSPDDFRDQVARFFYPQEGEESDQGLKVPIMGNKFAFRPGEMTLWTGHTSHGKSTLLSQVILQAGMAGQRAAIGSFEMKGHILMAKKVSCLTLAHVPPRTLMDTAIDWMQGKIWIYNIIGQVTEKKLEELMLYSLMRHGVQHYVIDSLMKCAVSSEDYEGQRKFVSFLHTFAIENNIHVHLVGHPRKDKDDLKEIGVYDVHGGNTVTSQPDNVISVFRHKSKEKARLEGSESDEALNVRPDATISIQKQRFNGEEYKIHLWFSKASGRYTHDREYWEDYTKLIQK